MIARETVYQTLLDLMAATGDFHLVSRRNRAPESITPDLSPALFLLEDGESYIYQSPSLPPKRCLHVLACFYNDLGADLNGTPTTIVNNALDALDRAMTPDVATGRTTLGGLVYSFTRPGRTQGSPGDREGKAVQIIPIEIMLP